MPRRLFTLLTVCASVHAGVAAAVAQGFEFGDYEFRSAVNIAKGSNPPAAPSLPQTMPPTPLTFSPTGGGPALSVAVTPRTTLTKEGAGLAGGCTMSFGTLSLTLPSPGTADLTYSVTLSYNFIITIFDHSNNESPTPSNNSQSITGTITGTVVVKPTGVVECDFNHIFVNMPTSNSVTVSVVGFLGTTNYQLSFGPCGLKGTSTTFPYFLETNIGTFGAVVVASPG